MKLPHLLTDAQRATLVKRIHRVRLRRLLIGTTIIALGNLIPVFHGHETLHAVTMETVKSIGYLPILKLFEDVMT